MNTKAPSPEAPLEELFRSTDLLAVSLRFDRLVTASLHPSLLPVAGDPTARAIAVPVHEAAAARLLLAAGNPTRPTPAPASPRGGLRKVVAGAMLIVLGGGLLLGISGPLGDVLAELRGPPPPPKLERTELPADGFRIEWDKARWSGLSKLSGEDAAFIVRRPLPETRFAIWTSEIEEGVSNEALAEDFERRTLDDDDGAEVERLPDLELNGLRFAERKATIPGKGGRLRAHRWHLAHGGRAFEIAVWSVNARWDELRGDGIGLLRGFSLVEPARPPGAPGTHPGIPSVARAGLRLPFPEGGWFVPTADEGTTAVVRAACGEQAAVVVHAALVGTSPVPAERLFAALATEAGRPLPPPGLERSPTRHGPFAGDVGLWAEGDAVIREERLLGEGVALLLSERSVARDGGDPQCPDVLAGVELTGPDPSGPVPAPLAALSRGLADRLATESRAQGDRATARVILEEALARWPDDVDLAWTLVGVSAGWPGSGSTLALLDRLLATRAASSPLLVVRGWLHEHEGRRELATRDYRRWFAAGGVDDDVFEHYTALLEERERRGEALEEARAYRGRRDTGAVLAVEAGLLRRAGRAGQAEELLRVRLRSGDPDGAIGAALIDLLRAREAWAEVRSVAARLEQDGVASSSTALALARAELALGDPAAAKRAVEAGLRRAPEDESLARFLAFVSDQLGEGANSSIKTAIEPVVIPASLLASGGEAPPISPGVPARYLLRVRAIEFRPGEELRTTDLHELRVDSPAGVDAVSTLEFEFEPHFESIYLQSLEVTDASGAILARGRVEDCYLSDLASSRMATARRVLHVPVPGLRPGLRLRAVVTRRAHRAPTTFPFERWTLQQTFPTERAVLLLRGATTRIATRASPGVEETQLDEGLAFSARGLAPLRWEPFAAPIDDFAASVTVGDAGGSWERELSTYLGALEPRFPAPPEVLALARGLSAGQPSEEAKLRAIARHVQRELTYKAIEFGSGATIPRPTATVLQNRYGDCKDHALLLVQLLRAAGIEAELALVRSRGPLARALASLDQFDHMIVHLPRATPRFLDVTSKGLDPLQSAALLAGQEALVVRRGAPQFVRIPGERPTAPELEVERELSPEADGNVRGRERVVARGWVGAALRQLLEDVEPERRASRLESVLDGVRLEHVEVSELHEPERPLVLELRWTARTRSQVVDAIAIVGTPAPWEQEWLYLDAPGPRVAPLHVATSMRLRSRTRLAAPTGHRAAELPAADASASGRGPLVRWTLTQEATSAGLEVLFDFDREAGRVGPERFDEHRAVVLEALARLDRPTRFRATAR